MTGPLTEASVVADGDRWTLIFIRELRQPPEQVWPALVDPDRLDRWAPFTASRPLTETGPATLTMADGDERTALPAQVRRVEPPHLLEYTWGEDLLRWELEPAEGGTRLTLRHTLADRDMDAMVAAGWHLCADVLGRLLAGEEVTAIRGRDAMNHGWERLRDHYAAVFAGRNQ
ncbi:SRPBCC family protein [Actinoplanes oblitus]|uniref:SRPBCC family protein n=1 Tax=Actinoplanes oblitus TaxID=3040509 RepID=A0ABY8WBS9_9ACTN|nr:SRPBCC family protein [Actinoplanes oblitus]WIM93854.1 SRPBCC family protein [Actinoplanes oblitus]